jgi:hypothetical protein
MSNGMPVMGGASLVHGLLRARASGCNGPVTAGVSPVKGFIPRAPAHL